ncbi:MAG: hypothetical protein QXI32_03450 [Candidatus Bathyarchaeia archaeon]
MSEEGKVEVTVRYRGMEVKLNGRPEEVVKAFLELMEKVVPGFELVSGLVLTVDLERLLKDLQGVIAITDEGLIVTRPRESIGEREAILLHLVKANVGYQLSRLKSDSLSIADILTLTGGKPSTTAARLSELVDLGWVERVGRGEYRITTYGIKSFQESVLPKLKVGGK